MWIFHFVTLFYWWKQYDNENNTYRYWYFDNNKLIIKTYYYSITNLNYSLLKRAFITNFFDDLGIRSIDNAVIISTIVLIIIRIKKNK